MNHPLALNFRSTHENPRLLIVGHSHGSTLLGAVPHLKTTRNIDIDCDILQLFGKYHDFSTVKDGEIVYNPDLLREIFDLIERNRPHLIVGPLLGSEYFMLCFNTSGRLFDLIVPGYPSEKMTPGCELIPFDIIYAMAYSAYSAVLGVLSFVEKQTGCKAVYIVPPPPGQDRDVFFSHLPEDLAIQFPKLTCRQLLNCWRAYNKAAEDICRKLNIEIVSPPKEAITEEGFLRAHLIQDAVHANIEYGAMILKDIASRFFDIKMGAAGQ